MARKGSRLFREMTDAEVNTADTAVRKGRSGEKIARRNEMLLHRYVYYAIHSELRLEAINRKLEEEFHLTERRLLDVICAHAPQIRALKAEPPTIAQLIKKYPHFAWSAKS